MADVMNSSRCLSFSSFLFSCLSSCPSSSCPSSSCPSSSCHSSPTFYCWILMVNSPRKMLELSDRSAEQRWELEPVQRVVSRNEAHSVCMDTFLWAQCSRSSTRLSSLSLKLFGRRRSVDWTSSPWRCCRRSSVLLWIISCCRQQSASS